MVRKFPHHGVVASSGGSSVSEATFSTATTAFNEPLPGVQVYVKNTFLEVAEADCLAEAGDDAGGQGMKALWQSMKSNRKTRSRSQPCIYPTGSSGSHCSDSTSDRSGFSSYAPSPRGSLDPSPKDSAAPSPRFSSAEGNEDDCQDVPSEHCAASIYVSQSLVQSPACDAPEHFGHDMTPQDSPKKYIRARPKKQNRLRGKQLAEMLFLAETDEAREQAEEIFLNATEDNEVLYEYAMSVLKKLRSQANELINCGEDPANISVHV